MGTSVPVWELASQKATLRPEMGTHVPNRELTARNGNLRPRSGDFASIGADFPLLAGRWLGISPLSRNVRCWDTRQIPDSDVVVLELGLASKSPDQRRIWRNKPFHEVELPAASDLERQRLPASSFFLDPAKDLAEVAAQLGRIVVPVRHLSSSIILV